MTEPTDTKPAKKPRAPRPKADKPADGKTLSVIGDTLPSMNIRHSADLANRLSILSASVANDRNRVQAEMDGQQRRHEDAKAEAQAKHELAMSDMDSAHQSRRTELVVQLQDLDRTAAILNAALAKASEAPPAPAEQSDV